MTINAGHTEWKWTCKTTYGATDTCSAPVGGGSCGAAIYGLYSAAPTSNLCGDGTSSTPVLSSDLSKWIWVCSTTYGTAANCSAISTSTGSGYANGSCGSAVYLTSNAAPTVNLCSTGSASTPTLSGSKYTWTCSGSGGGSAATCNSTYSSSVTDGACGTAVGTSTAAAPTANLCSVGTASTPAYSTDYKKWQWTCASTTGGGTTACTSNVSSTNGTCGITNGHAVPNQPNSDLCTTGVASTVNGSGPWSWICYGVGGGTNSGTCQATLCDACSGTQTASQTMSVSGTTSDGCSITGTAAWTETDAVSASGSAGKYVMSWVDSLGAHNSGTITQSAAAHYCTPCYASLPSNGSTTAPVVTISSMTGSCSAYTIGGTIAASSVTVTKQ